MFRRDRDLIGFALLFVFAAAPVPRADSGPSWLERLNLYRAAALLPPVVEDPALSGAVLQHAHYMVLHGVVKHSQKRRDAGATPEGAAAAAASNLAGSISPSEPDSWAVDTWMQAPFHALGILDPALQQVGFGIERAQRRRIQTAAGLDVIRGRSTAPTSISYPIVWPADGASVPLATHAAEYPSPLTSCPGYRRPQACRSSSSSARAHCRTSPAPGSQRASACSSTACLTKARTGTATASSNNSVEAFSPRATRSSSFLASHSGRAPAIAPSST